MRRLLSLLAATSLLTTSLLPVAVHAQTAPGELTLNALQGEPDNIDPQASSSDREIVVVRQVFESLLTLDRDLMPQPGAAESWEVTPDGRIWTFHIRAAQYSDGQPVLASHFEYAIKRLLDPELAAEYASFFVDAGIVGAAEYSSGNGSADVVGVKALDDQTLQITLKQAIGYFPSLMTLWVTSPVRPELAPMGSSAWSTDPNTYIGNGPFRMVEWSHQEKMVFEPNPYFRISPGVSRMTYLMVTDNTADYAAYLAGERDMTLVPDANVTQVLADPELSLQARQISELATFWLNVNIQRRPLNHGFVRKAFARAIDREAYIRDISQGVGAPTTSIIPPGMLGHSPHAGSDLSYNPEAARELLASAGYSGGAGFPTVKLTYATTPVNQRRAEFIQAQIKQNLGIDTELDPQEEKAYQANIEARNFDMTFGSWGADYPDPQNWYGPLFGCNGEINRFNYCNPAVDALIARADALTDQAERLELYNQVQNVLLNDLPVVPIFVPGRMVVVKPYVQGLTITAQDAYPGSHFYEEVTTNR